MDEEIKDLIINAYKLGFYDGCLQVTNITYSEIINKLNDPKVMNEITGGLINDESNSFDELCRMYKELHQS